MSNFYSLFLSLINSPGSLNLIICHFNIFFFFLVLNYPRYSILSFCLVQFSKYIGLTSRVSFYVASFSVIELLLTSRVSFPPFFFRLRFLGWNYFRVFNP